MSRCPYRCRQSTRPEDGDGSVEPATTHRPYFLVVATFPRIERSPRSPVKTMPLPTGSVAVTNTIGMVRLRTPARPSQRSIGGQDLHGCLTPNRPAKPVVRADPPRFLPLPRYPFRPRLACCRGSRQGVFASPRFYWLRVARPFSRKLEYE